MNVKKVEEGESKLNKSPFLIHADFPNSLAEHLLPTIVFSHCWKLQHCMQNNKNCPREGEIVRFSIE